MTNLERYLAATREIAAGTQKVDAGTRKRDAALWAMFDDEDLTVREIVELTGLKDRTVRVYLETNPNYTEVARRHVTRPRTRRRSPANATSRPQH